MTNEFWNMKAKKLEGDEISALIKKMTKARDLQFKSHKRDDELVLTEDGKWWAWCFTHKRYEPPGWIS